MKLKNGVWKEGYPGIREGKVTPNQTIIKMNKKIIARTRKLIICTRYRKTTPKS